MGSPLTAVRSQPCSACPYRRDCPSGVWEYDEYEKLRPYDEETWGQPVTGFRCHATPGHHCCGWAVVHSRRGHEYELLALRWHWPEGGIPHTDVAFFASGTEAADHGQADVEDLSDEAVETVERLMRKHGFT